MKNAGRSSDLKINENFASRLQKVFRESFLNLIYRSEAFPKASYYYAYVSHCQEKKKRKRKRQAVRSLKDVYLAILLFNIFHLSRLVLIYGSLITLSSACVYVYMYVRLHRLIANFAQTQLQQFPNSTRWHKAS